MNSGQSISKRLDRRREPVVHFVSGSPQSVATGLFFGRVCDLKNSIIGGNPLERDTAKSVSMTLKLH
jgi:hypothetical protein